METATLAELRTWFAERCDGDWERGHSIRISSTAFPGWRVEIDVRGTPFAKRAFTPVKKGNGDAASPLPPWLSCRVEDGVFIGAGDVESLEEILQIFLTWAAPRRKPR